MSETHEHLEHAEHAEHAAHNPFDKRIAMTIAIVAAMLAGVAMVGHRTHNDVLRYQADANRFRTEAATTKVQKSNQFAWYQAKRQRQAQLEAIKALSSTIAPAEGKADDKKKIVEKWDKDIKKYAEELPGMETDGKKLGVDAQKLTKKAEEMMGKAEHAHHQADWLDYAHLAVELGLVLCSIAVLTKRKGFWFSGIVVSIVGVALVCYAFSLPAHDHHDEHPADSPGHQQEHKDSEKHDTKPKDDSHGH